MERDENPFVPGFGAVPPALTGREREFADLESALRRVARGFYERPRVITGDRGLGKTSILTELAASARERHDVWTVDVEATRVGDVFVPMLRQLHAALRAYDFDARVGDLTARALAAITAFGLRHAGIELSLDLAERSDRRAGTGDLATDLGTVLEDVGRLALEAGAAVLLTIDEIQSMPATHLGPLFAALQQSARIETEPGRHLPVLVVVAGLPHAIATMRKAAATYVERMREHPLELLTDAAAAEALIIPFEERAVAVDPVALQSLVRTGGGYPYLIQLLGYEAWNAAADGTGALDTAVAEVAADRAMSELRRVYESRLETVPETELRYLLAVAALAEGDRRSQSIAAALGGRAAEWAWARSRLIDRGLLRPAGHGRVTFALPGIGEHLREHYPGRATDRGPGTSRSDT